jgi:hypothetical protein
VFWVGDADGAGEVGERFRKLLAGCWPRSGTVTEPPMAVQKRVSAYGAAVDGLITKISFDGAGADRGAQRSNRQPIRFFEG